MAPFAVPSIAGGGSARRGARTTRARRMPAHGCAVSRPRRSREAQGILIRRKRIRTPRQAPSLLVTFGQCQKELARRRRVKAFALQEIKIKLDYTRLLPR